MSKQFPPKEDVPAFLLGFERAAAREVEHGLHQSASAGIRQLFNRSGSQQIPNHCRSGMLTSQSATHSRDPAFTCGWHSAEFLNLWDRLLDRPNGPKICGMPKLRGGISYADDHAIHAL